MEKELSSDFIIELVKLCLDSKKVLDICKQHLKYHYLYNDSQKKVFKFILENYEITGRVPTIGMIGQAYSTDQDTISFLSRVKKVIIDKDQHESILETFEVYIKDSKFRVLYDKIGDLYNEGKQQQAIDLLNKESQEIANFKLKDNYYTAVFRDFEKRQQDRQENKSVALLDKLTFGIHECDDVTRGGFNKGTSVLIMARSGVGKSTFLRWIGLCNARLGRRVVHFQAEGTEKECLDAYDAGWTSVSTHDIEFGQIPESKKVKIFKAQKDILAGGGEIYVYASESFDSMTMDNCYDIIKDITEIYGDVDLVLFDYLEIFTLKGSFGSSEASERKRREEIANKMTNIAVEFKCGVATAYQGQDIAPAQYNNEEFVMTRHHASEFKNIIKPFSVFITVNQTDDEDQNEILRIWFDKIRKYKKPNKPIRIYQSRENGRFYNSLRTLQEFYTTIAKR